MQRALWEVGSPIETPGNSELRVNVCLFFLAFFLPFSLPALIDMAR